MTPITGHRVLVIGAGRLGAAVATAALREGAQVMISPGDASNLRAVDETSTPCTVFGVADNLSGDQVEQTLMELLEEATKSGLLDHIVYAVNRSDHYYQALGYLGIEDAVNMARLPMIVPLFIGKIAPRYMNRHIESSITFSTGSSAHIPEGFSYAAAPFIASTETISKYLALELMPVRVNAVYPASPESEWPAPLSTWLQNQLAKNSLVAAFGAVEDVSDTFLYLMKNPNATSSLVVSNGRFVS